MDKRKLYRIMAGISGAVSLAAVIALSAALVAGPMSGEPEPVEVMAGAGEPENHADEPEPPQSSSKGPESAKKSPEQGADSGFDALNQFMIPTDWTGKIVRESGTFYVSEAHEAYAKGESGYSGELLTVGAAGLDEWPLTGAERLGQREDKVYYVKLPGTVTFAFGADTEADRDYFRMQTDLKAALTEYFS